MDNTELEAKEAALAKREQELNEKEQKLDEDQAKYKQEVEDRVNATFNERVNKAIEKQTEAIREEQDTLLNKQKDLFSKEILLGKKEKELELKELEIKNKEQELKNSYEAELKETMRTKKVEFDAQLAKEFNEKFNEKFKEKIDSLKNRQKELIEQQAHLEEQQDTLDAEKKAFESSKERALQRLKDEVQAKVDSLDKQLKSEKTEREKLLEAYDTLMQSYGKYERFKDRDLRDENSRLEQELNKLEGRLEQVEEDKEKIQGQADEKKKLYEGKLNEIKQYDDLKLKFDRLEIKHGNLEEQLKEQLREQDYYKNQYEIADKRLKQLQSQFMGKEEQIKREEAIKQDYTLEILLHNENKNKQDNELEWLKNIENNMEKYGVKYPQRLLYAFHTALKTASMSPISVLSGVSGTGKSELPKLYAHFGGFNFLSDAVQPTWDSPASMVGFYNTIEGKFDATNLFKFLVQTSINSKQKDENAPNPYGLKESMNLILLDELNLAHIELYFAEFLSKFETKRGSSNVNLDIPIGAGLTMPIELDSNLLWVGTMNEDETTKSLSDKVLDRAFCINFPRPKKLVSRLELKKLNEIAEFKWLPKTTWESWVNKAQKVDLTKYKKITEQINEKLAKAHRAIGHRVWQSMEAYMLHYPLIDDQEKVLKIAFEDAIVQKIMPKLRGIEPHGEEQKALVEIKEIIVKEVPNLEKDFEYAMSNPYGQFKFNSAYYLDSQENAESKEDKKAHNE